MNCVAEKRSQKMASRPDGYGFTAEVKRNLDSKYSVALGETSSIPLKSTAKLTAKHYFNLNLEES